MSEVHDEKKLLGDDEPDDTTGEETTGGNQGAGKVEANQDKERRCGCFSSIRCFLFWFCWAGAIQGMVVNGFVNVIVTTIERRFHLSSFDTGVIASGYDAAMVICIIPVSYMGGRAHKPRWIGVGLIIMGIGSFIFALPHFVAPSSDIFLAENLCPVAPGNRTVARQCPSASFATQLEPLKYIMLLGQILHGIGASPLFSLGLSYLDENLPPDKSSLYVGIFFTTNVIGPAVGYIAGGQLLKVYTNFHKDDVNTLEDSLSDSPNFTGAWWFGFIIASFMAFVVSVPIMGFPRRMPGVDQLQVQDRTDSTEFRADQDAKLADCGTDGLQRFPRELKVLLTNPVFMCLCWTTVVEGIMIMGFATYAPKYLETQYGFTPTISALLIGAVAVPAGGGGMFLGGLLVKKFAWNTKSILKFCIFCTSMQIGFALIFLFHCPNVNFEGVDLQESEHLLPDDLLQGSQCSSQCDCAWNYQPMCGLNGRQYYSACFAGCSWVDRIQISDHRGTPTTKEKVVYGNCSCLGDVSHSHLLAHPDSVTVKGKGRVMGYQEPCGTDCSHRYIWFLILFFWLLFLMFLRTAPGLSAMLRLVGTKQKSFALGVNSLMMTLFGTIPAPPAVGYIIDRTCIVWGYSRCRQERESCHFYSNKTMSRYLLLITLCGKLLSTMIIVLAYVIYTRHSKYKHEGSGGGSNDGDKKKEYGTIDKEQ